MQVLVCQHAPLEGLGSIAGVLERRGIGRRSGEYDVSGAAGLILMGGPMSANDDLPWIPREIAAIREAAGRGIPVLGICLGAQLIARALGSRVYPNTVKEIGWFEVHPTSEARGDPLFAGFTEPETVFQWHGETFGLPAGASLLASGENCRNQAFRHGGSIYGLQFHLETTPAIIAEWLRQDARCGAGAEATVPIDPNAHARRMAALSAGVFEAWCDLLR